MKIKQTDAATMAATADPSATDTADQMTLRGYQSSIVGETLTALETHSRVVVACPTGSGKTVIAIRGLLPKLPGKTAWVTHRKELAKQAREYGQALDVFMAQGGIVKALESLWTKEKGGNGG